MSACKHCRKPLSQCLQMQLKALHDKMKVVHQYVPEVPKTYLGSVSSEMDNGTMEMCFVVQRVNILNIFWKQQPSCCLVQKGKYLSKQFSVSFSHGLGMGQCPWHR